MKRPTRFNNGLPIAVGAFALAAAGMVTAAHAGDDHQGGEVTVNVAAGTAMATFIDDADDAIVDLLLAAGDTDDAKRRVLVQRWNGDHAVDVAREVKVEVEDDQVSVWIDGEKVPAERLQRREGRIIVLDENGEEMRSVRIWEPGDEQWMHWKAMDEGAGAGAFAFRRFDDSGSDVQQPAVMLGVYMEPPGDALCAHLKIDPNSSTLISGVFDGLPAQSAGLALHDVIVAINGSDDAGPSQVRDILRERKPGDTLNLTVIHQGERRSVDVTLAAYDQQKMKSATLHGGAMASDRASRRYRELIISPFGRDDEDGKPIFVAPPEMDGLNVDAREVHRIIREALREAFSHAEDARWLTDDIREHINVDIDREVDRHMESLQQKMEAMERMMQRMEQRLHERHDAEDNRDD